MTNTLFTLENRLPLAIITGFLASQFITLSHAGQPGDSPVAGPQWNDHTGRDGNRSHDQGVRNIEPLKSVSQTPVLPEHQDCPSASVTVKAGTATTGRKPPEPAITSNVATAAVTTAPVASEPPAVMKTLDWVSLTQLPPGRQSSRDSLLCKGGYLEPERPGMDYVGDPAHAPIHATADTSTYQDGGVGNLCGNVVISPGLPPG